MENIIYKLLWKHEVNSSIKIGEKYSREERDLAWKKIVDITAHDLARLAKSEIFDIV